MPYTLLRKLSEVGNRRVIQTKHIREFSHQSKYLLAVIGLIIGFIFSTAALAQEDTAPLSRVADNAPSQDAQHIPITYVKIAQPAQSGIPRYLETASNSGTAGARIAITDANITGRFLGYSYTLNVVDISAASDLATELSTPEEGTTEPTEKNSAYPIILLDAPSSEFTEAMDIIAARAPESVIINVSNSAPALRQTFCDRPLLHTIPSYEMKTDALAQWFRVKRINAILAIYGSHDHDMLFLDALKTSAKKFKLKIVDTKQWTASFDLRRAAFSEIPLFTRTDEKYQAVFAADMGNQFAYSLPFNTDRIVPVVGSAGLKPLGWHFTHEQWGARQLQNRFLTQCMRSMDETDYAAYSAIIALSTAQQQGTPANGRALYRALLNDSFSLAAYKGRPLSFRANSGQLRQPIALAHEDALVTHAPLPGFLHQTNELDTLGAVNLTCKDLL